MLKKDALAYTFGIIALAVYFVWGTYFFPFYNWDLIPYLASALSGNIGDINELHTTTYELLQDFLPESDFTELTSGLYDKHMYHHPGDFYSQLRFYEIKPLYILSLQFFIAIDVPEVYAPHAVSTAAGFLLGSLLFVWISRYTPIPVAFVLTLLLIMISRISLMARLSSPDILSALLIFSSLYLLIEKRLFRWAFPIMIAAIFVRANNVIFVSMITSYYIFAQVDLKSLFKPNSAQLSFFAAIASYFLITLSADAYSWWTLFYHSFVEKINNPAEFNVPFSLSIYFEVLEQAARALAVTGVFMPTMVFCFAILSYFILAGREHPSFRKEHGHLLLILFANMLVYFLVFPSVFEWDRFFAPFYLTIFMLTLMRWHRALKPKSTEISSG